MNTTEKFRYEYKTIKYREIIFLKKKNREKSPGWENFDWLGISFLEFQISCEDSLLTKQESSFSACKESDE